MQKLMKKWVFTLVVCILLAVLAVLMFLSGFKVGKLNIGGDILHIVAAVALILYVFFALFPQMWRYRGALQGFAIGEVVILLLTAVAHIFMGYVTIPLISSLEICSVLGLALWLRGVVETVHAYLSNAKDASDPKRIPLWQLLLYILLSAFGVWQLVSPLLPDKFFVFAIGTASAVIAVIFGIYTVNNRKDTAAERKAKKEAKAKKQAEKEAQKEKKLAEFQAKVEKTEAKKAEKIAAKAEKEKAKEPVALLPSADSSADNKK